MELNERTRETIKRLASLTDDDIAEIALDVAEATLDVLNMHQVVIGASGDPQDLHIRVGRRASTDGGTFAQLGERTLGPGGGQFAKNTGQDGKAGTAAEYQTDSARAFRHYGNGVGPEGPRRWRGGKRSETVRDLPDGTTKIMDDGIGSASGAQGAIDEVPSAGGSQTVTALTLLRDEARELLAAEAEQKAADERNAALSNTVLAGTPDDRTVRA